VKKTLILVALFLLPAVLTAQQSGRHFRRPDRTPATPAATAQPAEAAAKPASSSARVQPMRKLRSGRAWSSFHFSRMPQSSPTPSGPSVTDASAQKGTTRKSPMWGRILRG
jgi:hypothetical protein